jgi:hypothetical protein
MERRSQKAKLHPMYSEALRALVSLHQRSDPQLINIAKRAGLAEL